MRRGRQQTTLAGGLFGSSSGTPQATATTLGGDRR
jgi:hypothetical protein